MGEDEGGGAASCEAAQVEISGSEMEKVLRAKQQLTGALVRFEDPGRFSPDEARTAIEPAVRAFLQSMVASVSHPAVPLERRIFLTLTESAELSGLPAGFLRRLIRDGKLKAIRAGSRWRIPRVELEALAGKLTSTPTFVDRQQLSEAQERDLEMNRLRRQGLLPPPDIVPEIN
jgi:excisionase family DNA binding protein